MKALFVLRHAKSSWDDPTLSDAERPLNARGRRDAPRIARAMQERGWIPDALVSSTARRAMETAELVKTTLAFQGPWHRDGRLYMATPGDILTVLAEIPELLSEDPESVLLIGHNPGLQDFVELITGQFVRLPTAGLARLDIGVDSWSELGRTTQATLGAVLTPKDLPAE